MKCIVRGATYVTLAAAAAIIQRRELGAVTVRLVVDDTRACALRRLATDALIRAVSVHTVGARRTYLTFTSSMTLATLVDIVAEQAVLVVCRRAVVARLAFTVIATWRVDALRVRCAVSHVERTLVDICRHTATTRSHACTISIQY